jgi:ribonuclease R
MQAVIAKFGHKIDFKQGSISQALNKLMEDVMVKEQNLIDTLAISMSKANILQIT